MWWFGLCCLAGVFGGRWFLSGGFDNAVVASGLVLLYFLVFLFCVDVII